MTRKEYETICRILSRAQRPEDRDIGFPMIPSAEWMRRRIGFALCEHFGLKGEAKHAFLRAARLEAVTAPVTTATRRAMTQAPYVDISNTGWDD